MVQPGNRGKQHLATSGPASGDDHEKTDDHAPPRYYCANAIGRESDAEYHDENREGNDDRPMGNRYAIYTPANWNLKQYIAKNPELKAHWDSNPGLQAHYKGDFNAWAQNHYYSLPASERSKWWPEGAATPPGGKGGGGGGGEGGGTDFGGY